ncbi:hypothetical protein R1sor_021670 [Riccia sorocarpa]|uniref:Uncharacterized protein n=1 Tax=Riccia sorocarpa TaxID=122646 RepID=A0ABD3GLY2_9MARC
MAEEVEGSGQNAVDGGGVTTALHSGEKTASADADGFEQVSARSSSKGGKSKEAERSNVNQGQNRFQVLTEELEEEPEVSSKDLNAGAGRQENAVKSNLGLGGRPSPVSVESGVGDRVQATPEGEGGKTSQVLLIVEEQHSQDEDFFLRYVRTGKQKLVEEGLDETEVDEEMTELEPVQEGGSGTGEMEERLDDDIEWGRQLVADREVEREKENLRRRREATEWKSLGEAREQAQLKFLETELNPSKSDFLIIAAVPDRLGLGQKVSFDGELSQFSIHGRAPKMREGMGVRSTTSEGGNRHGRKSLTNITVAQERSMPEKEELWVSWILMVVGLLSTEMIYFWMMTKPEIGR